MPSHSKGTRKSSDQSTSRRWNGRNNPHSSRLTAYCNGSVCSGDWLRPFCAMAPRVMHSNAPSA